MKKCAAILTAMLMVLLYVPATAQGTLTAEDVEGYLCECTVEELLHFRKWIDSELEKRDYALQEEQDYLLNISSRKFHLPSCSGAAKIKSSNRKEYTGTREELLAVGYDPCGICNP